jgi:hypothetical protein
VIGDEDLDPLEAERLDSPAGNEASVSANARERARTLATFAMQKVVGSSPIIRFNKAPETGFFVASIRSGGSVRSAFVPIRGLDRRPRAAVRQAIALLRRLSVDAQREARVFVAELVGRVSNVVTAGTAEACVGAPQRVERDGTLSMTVADADGSIRAPQPVGYANPSVMLLGRIRGSARRVGRGGEVGLAGLGRPGVDEALGSVVSARAPDAAYGCCSGRRRRVGHVRVACGC